MTDEWEPNPDAVRRITAHLLGEDIRNVKAAVELFPNDDYTIALRTARAIDAELLAKAMRVSLDMYGWDLDAMAAEIAPEYARLAAPTEDDR